MRNKIFEEDKMLTKAVETPSEKKPRFNWAEALGSNRFEVPKVRIADECAGDRDFHIAEVADVIGEALTDLMISREENEIYTPKNRELVVESSRTVADRLVERMAEEDEGVAPRLSFEELYRLIEKALVENDAYDVAKSLVISRSGNGTSDNNFSGPNPNVSQIRLIRRSYQVVPWNSAKIEVAVRKAFLSLRLDSEPAVEVANNVTQRAISTGQAFINIEDVQDIVQEELMRKGYFKVAESYILYRARRRIEREVGGVQDEVKQDSMIVVKKKDGSSFSGMELTLRKEFLLQV